MKITLTEVRINPWAECYSGQGPTFGAALLSYFKARNQGRRPFTPVERLEAAVSVGLALAHKSTVAIMPDQIKVEITYTTED